MFSEDCATILADTITADDLIVLGQKSVLQGLRRCRVSAFSTL